MKFRAFLLRRDASSPPRRLARLTYSFIQKYLHLSIIIEPKNQQMFYLICA